MRKVYYNSIVARLFLIRKGYSTAMIFGFICTKGKRSAPLASDTVNHEAIHVEQYMEITAAAIAIALVMSFIFGWAAWPFVLALMFYYLVYFVEAAISWVHNYFAHRKKDATTAADKAYYNSMFEMEAHAHDTDMEYISTRKAFHWVRNFSKI